MMTTRDAFAAAALTGILATPGHDIKGTMTGALEFKYDPEWYARQAFDIADAMVKEGNARLRERAKRRPIR